MNTPQNIRVAVISLSHSTRWQAAKVTCSPDICEALVDAAALDLLMSQDEDHAKNRTFHQAQAMVAYFREEARRAGMLS